MARFFDMSLQSFATSAPSTNSNLWVSVPGVGYYIYESSAERRRVTKALKRGVKLQAALQCWDQETFEEEIDKLPSPQKETRAQMRLRDRAAEALKTSEELQAQEAHTQKMEEYFSWELQTYGEDDYTYFPAVIPNEIVRGNHIKWGALESYAKELAKLSQEAELKAAHLAKWQKGELPWQQMLSYLQAKYNLNLKGLTCEEWGSKQLSSERVKALGLRSPKLSKALVALGVPTQEVSILLGANYENKKLGAKTEVLQNSAACMEQGNSIYYSSCQATNSRAAWNGSQDYIKVRDELPYIGKTWFLWVVGQPMSVDDKGFEARAKLRVMYTDKTCKEVAGLYIDRPYGKYQTLLDSLYELEIWWAEYQASKGWSEAIRPILMPPVWQRENGAGNDFQYSYGGRYSKKLYCPSATYGYQDTLNQGIGGYDCFVDITANRKSLLMEAYTKRTKIGGVYHNSLQETNYNPQKGLVTAPVVTLPQWRQLDDLDREFIAEFYQMTGKRVKDLFVPYRHSEDREYGRTWQFSVGGANFEATYNPKEESGVFHKLENTDTHTAVWYYTGPDEGFNIQTQGYSQKVLKDLPVLGYAKAVDIPYHHSSTGILVKEQITLAMVEEGFAPAWPLLVKEDAIYRAPYNGNFTVYTEVGKQCILEYFGIESYSLPWGDYYDSSSVIFS